MQKVARAWLITISLLNGLAGFVCGVLLIARPDGGLLTATALLPVIASFPMASIFFRDMFWIGVAMILVLGAPNGIAAVMLIRQNARQYQAALGAAVLLMCWCTFELIFMFNGAAIGYFAVAIVSALCAGWLLRAPHVAGA